jgi:hypothetical protein
MALGAHGERCDRHRPCLGVTMATAYLDLSGQLVTGFPGG